MAQKTKTLLPNPVFLGPILFDTIDPNVGGAMSDAEFKAPHEGIYLFSFTANTADPSVLNDPAYRSVGNHSRIDCRN